MTCKNTWAGLALAIGLSLSLSACKDTKTLQENEQLKTQVAELQKENGQVGNNLEIVTADRDSVVKENVALKAQIYAHAHKAKRVQKKTVGKRRRR